MKQTPVHDFCNPDLLRLIPVNARSVVEVGCGSGALAREFKKRSPQCDYLGVEVDSSYADLASRYCDSTLVMNIEDADAAFWQQQARRDCWIFGDVLEHLRDPWQILERVRAVIPGDGSLVVCVPNAQHWSLQVRLNGGNFRYEDEGLLDRTHLRWFSRITLSEMLDKAGFSVVDGATRVFDEPSRDAFLPVIGKMAKLVGIDPAMAIRDSIPFQYVVRAAPK